MGVKSTHDVTREFAIEAIIKRLPYLNNQQLARVLEDAIYSCYHNFSIVDQSVIDIQLEKYDHWDYCYLDDINDLPEMTEEN